MIRLFKKSKRANYTCPVCGYDKLYEPPYEEEYYTGSYEICPCCGCEYGYDDFDYDLYTFKTAREKWIQKGAKWFSPRNRPRNWVLEEQLKNIGNLDTYLEQKLKSRTQNLILNNKK